MSNSHRELPRGGHANGSTTKSLNQAITQAATLQVKRLQAPERKAALCCAHGRLPTHL